MIHVGQVIEGLAHVRVACTQGLFSDRQRALEEPLSLRVLALGSIHEGQVIECLAHVGVVRTERFLADGQRALVEPLRLAVLALRRYMARLFSSGPRRVFTEHFFADRQARLEPLRLCTCPEYTRASLLSATA